VTDHETDLNRATGAIERYLRMGNDWALAYATETVGDYVREYGRPVVVAGYAWRLDGARRLAKVKIDPLWSPDKSCYGGYEKQRSGRENCELAVVAISIGDAIEEEDEDA
jgi:hypothetical protein